jgi:peroxiredoxin Q/BCP
MSASTNNSGPGMNRVVGDFTAEATGDQTVGLKDLRGKHVILYFYPKDSTPGCTTEGRDFSALHSKFQQANTIIFGISRDRIASHEKFKAKLGFKFDLISDPDEKLCRQFDVIREKTLYGRKFIGVVRSTFLIDSAGKLRGEWRNLKVKGHAQSVYEAVQALPD